MESNTNNKHDAIVQAARELFWKHGVKRVTVEEVCQQAEVSKMTFYKFFNNKKVLALEILKTIIERPMQKMEALVASDAPFEEKAQQMIWLKFEGTKGISNEFLQDVYHNKKLGLHEYIEQQQQRSKKLLLALLHKARARNEIRKEIKDAFVLAYMDQLSVMLSQPQLLEQYDTPQDAIMEGIHFFLYGLGVKCKEV